MADEPSSDQRSEIEDLVAAGDRVALVRIAGHDDVLGVLRRHGLVELPD